ncbi:MAG: PaaI family thioesterase [Geminicoccaceae bacterium]
MRRPAHRSYAHETALIEPSVALEMSGLEIMEAIRDGRLPIAAIAQTIDFRLVEVEAGRTVFEGEPDRHVHNMFGAAHGGYAATLLDSAMGCAVQTTVPKGRAYTTVDLTINYVRPILLGAGTVRAEGKVLHSGRRTATADGRLVGADGRLYAHGITTCLIFPVDEMRVSG